jgi:hypothetical protein
MATVPTMRTWTAGEIVTASMLNSNVRDLGTYWTTSRPMAQMRQTVAQTLTTAVFGSITFTTEDLDRDGGHDTVTNTSRYTAQTAGWYLVAGSVGFAGNNTGRRGCRLAVNGTALNGSLTIVASAGVGTCQIPAVTRIVTLSANDYVEVQGIQESGGNLNTAVTAENQSTLTVVWVGS